MKKKGTGKERTTREVAKERYRDAVQEKRKDDLFEELLKQVGAGTSGSDVLGLTCAESNVDAILSDGESV